VATRRDVTDSPSEQGLEVGPSGSGSPLNVRTRKHPAREVSTSGCGPVRCRRGLRVTARSPDHSSEWESDCRPFGVGHDGLRVVVARFALAAPPVRRWEVEQGSVPSHRPSRPSGRRRLRSSNTMTWGSLRFAGEIGASSTGPTGTCMRPFNGLSPPRPLFGGRGRDLGGTLALRAGGPPSCGRKIVGCRPDSSGKRQEGNGRGDAARLKVRGILRRVSASRGRRSCSAQLPIVLFGGREEGAIGREKSENAMNPMTGSEMQQARSPNRGGNRRGGATPRGRNGSRRVASSARRNVHQ